jgi:hypothetical protein
MIKREMQRRTRPPMARGLACNDLKTLCSQASGDEFAKKFIG